MQLTSNRWRELRKGLRSHAADVRLYVFADIDESWHPPRQRSLADGPFGIGGAIDVNGEKEGLRSALIAGREAPLMPDSHALANG